MIKTILKRLYYYGQNLFERSIEMYIYYAENKKYKDPRRVAIYSKIHLTKEQQKTIDDFYLKNYGRKISYTWHRHYLAFTGNFDVNYLPEPLYAAKFERYLHDNNAYCRAVSDKNLLPYLAQAAQVKTAATLLSRVTGFFRDKDNLPLSRQQFKKKLENIGEVFIKPSIDSSSGLGCRVIHIKQGKDIRSGKSAEQLIQELGRDFIVQERLRSHPSVAAIYPHSVNTFRIVTYRWKEDILLARSILKIGRGGKNVENAHAGGIFVAVDEDGTLHKTAFTEFNEQFTEHPDTHIVFEGYKIPHFNQLREAAKKIHTLIPQIGCYHWDFILGVEGEPILMEANTTIGGIGSIQMAHGKGLFGENTAEILRWTAKMEKLSYNERKFYNYGYMEKRG